MSSADHSKPGGPRVGYAQLRPTLGDVPLNLALIEELVSDVQFDLLVLPELATTGYALPDRATARVLAEPIPGPTPGSSINFADRARRWRENARKRDYLSAGVAAPR